MDTFFERLEARARTINSLLCVGLDPHPADLPDATGEAALAFCVRLIEQTADVAVAYKPNVAFFEALGAPGMDALRQVIDAVPPRTPVILDAKRGDIASTAWAYVRAIYEYLGVDAVTISPYLGRDAVTPFLEDPGRGVFLLCKTSNPGAADLQDLRVKEEGRSPSQLYEVVAKLAQSWNQFDNLGLVVGATHLEALARVRRLVPGMWILAPGVGAQGGDLEAALRAGLRADGLGLLVPVSRGISRADDPQGAAERLWEAINHVRREIRQKPNGGQASLTTTDHLKTKISEGLLATGCVQFGDFTLKSGRQSPIYIDLRRLASHPQLLSHTAAAYVPILKQMSFDRLAALPYGALPIATAISLQTGWPLIYPRKEVKAYGTRSSVEGEFRSGEYAVVIDDLVTTGESKFEGIKKLTAVGVQVSDVVVLIDRQSGAAEALAKEGYQLQAVFTLVELLDYWDAQGSVVKDRLEAVRTFLRES